MPWFLMNPIGEMTKGLIFIDQSKTGSTTTCRVFERAVCESNGHLGGGHTCASFIQFNYRKYFNTYHTFSIIRNPYDRFISAFFFEKQKFTDPEITEEAFRAVMKKKESYPMISQLQFISDKEGNIIVDELIKYENMKEGVGRMVERYKIPYVDVNDFDKLTFQKTKKKGSWQQYYKDNPVLWDIVPKIYGGDIELWKTL